MSKNFGRKRERKTDLGDGGVDGRIILKDFFFCGSTVLEGPWPPRI
jgi:hypothetical protein